MLLTHEQIIALKNPYQTFNTADTFAEHVHVLNQLSNVEQVSLATLLIKDCPDSAIKRYYHQIEALNTRGHNGFYSIMQQAYQVRARISALLAPNMKTPHQLFLGTEWAPDSFCRFRELANQLIADKEQKAAIRLALSTPKELVEEVLFNLESTFSTTGHASENTMVIQATAAFKIRQTLDLLLGEHPEQFFETQDIKDIKDAYYQYPNLFQTLLQGQEEQIGKKLSALSSIASQSSIRRQLELLHTEPYDDNNPFKLIAQVMDSKKPLEQKNVSCPTKTPMSWFHHQPQNVAISHQSDLNVAEENTNEHTPFFSK